jgi:hypothetical protein
MKYSTTYTKINYLKFILKFEKLCGPFYLILFHKFDEPRHMYPDIFKEIN